MDLEVLSTASGGDVVSNDVHGSGEGSGRSLVYYHVNVEPHQIHVSTQVHVTRTRLFGMTAAAIMHEIITIQLGQQANYAATHYWNSQESYFTYTTDEESPVNHDVSFRPGIGADGSETYTPRALIYDLKGAFGSLRRENALYQLEQDFESQRSGNWHASAIPLRLPRIEPSPYQQALDQGEQPPPLTSEVVRYWSDFNHIFYHPRSIIQLNDYELNSSLMPFEQWKVGDEFFATLDREQDILDRDLRPFLEECDHIQGIQVLSSIDDAWGGFASRYLERIADDLGKGSRWIFGFQDARRTTFERQRIKSANIAQSIYALSFSTSMHIPMANVPAVCPQYLSLATTSRWHTAAMQAVAIESITLPTRLHHSLPGSSTFDRLDAILGNDGQRPIASCEFSVNDPDVEGSIDSNDPSTLTNGHINHENYELNGGTTRNIDLCPEFSTNSNQVRQREDQRVHLFSKVEFQRGSTHTGSDNEMSERQDRRIGDPRKEVLHSTLPFPILSSFPLIFRFNNRPQRLVVNSSLSTTSIISNRIRNLEQISRRMIEIEERETLCDGLATIAEEYEEGWMSDQDSSDDE